MTRFYGVFAPNSKHRAEVTGDGKEKQPSLPATTEPLVDCEERRLKMSWAMRLKRVFNIDITVCSYCQGPVKIIACIEDVQVINKILAHINQQSKPFGTQLITQSVIRAPPAGTISMIKH